MKHDTQDANVVKARCTRRPRCSAKPSSNTANCGMAAGNVYSVMHCSLFNF